MLNVDRTFTTVFPRFVSSFKVAEPLIDQESTTILEILVSLYVNL